jgi:arginine deiminase
VSEPNEELQQLSPAAAAACSFLKSGKSLTAIYSEHLRLVSELERKNAEFKQIEHYVTELIQVFTFRHSS